MFEEIQSELQKTLNLDQVSFIELKTPITIDFYEKWLNQNFYGSMDYLKNHFPLKKDSKSINPEFKSVITVTQSYFPTVEKTKINLPARIAMYAQNNDYHFWLKEKLQQAIEKLKFQFPDEVFVPYVDSGPILEKDFAYQAGHGWFGKNSCLIHPQKGSLFFVAEILTTVDVSKRELKINPDMCGTCTRCMEACPTQAIIEPKVIKADQCISYLTIESKTAPPIELRKKMNDWFFGCDICQTVCPWNEKAFRIQKVESSKLTSTHNLLDLNFEDRTELVDFFRMILTSSNKQLQKYFYGTALHRAAGFGLKRNALIVIGNRNLMELKSEVLDIKKEPKLQELADWTLLQLTQ